MVHNHKAHKERETASREKERDCLRKQIQQLKLLNAFSEQEINEKVEEIEVKADVEFNIEKERHFQQQSVQVINYYEHKQKTAERKHQTDQSRLLNNGRLLVLARKEERLQELKKDARAQLSSLSKDADNYRSIIEALITQGLFKLLEPRVIIRCRQMDLSLVEEVLSKAVEAYKAATDKSIRVSVDKESFLSPTIAGGVELSNPSGEIRIVNTLESRLDHVFEMMLPELKEDLFGANPNRKFND